MKTLLRSTVLALAMLAQAAGARAETTCDSLTQEFNNLIAEHNRLVQQYKADPKNCEPLYGQITALTRLVALEAGLKKSCPKVAGAPAQGKIAEALDSARATQRTCLADQRARQENLPRGAEPPPPTTDARKVTELYGAPNTEMLMIYGLGGLAGVSLLALIVTLVRRSRARRAAIEAAAAAPLPYQAPPPPSAPVAPVPVVVEPPHMPTPVHTPAVHAAPPAATRLADAPASLLRFVPVAGGAAVEVDRLRLAPNGASLGRDPHCDVVIGNEYVSSRHARIWFDKRGLLIVEDIGSSNGTFRGKDRIKNASFRPGDIISFGRAQFKLEY